MVEDKQSDHSQVYAFLALGTNLGDRKKYLENSIFSLEQKGIRVIEQSPIYETKAVGFTEQPDFLNRVIKVETDQTPEKLLANILAVEKEYGRVRDIKWGPRTLDIDLLFYDNLVLNKADLIIPHPRMQDRAFVLFPLRDIAPDYVHPVLKMTISKMAKQVPEKGGIRRWEKSSAKGYVPIEN